MFKALTPYRLTARYALDPEHVEQALEAAPFVSCGPTQPLSVGFVPPRGKAHGLLAEWINGHGVALLKFEERKVPPEALRRRVDEMAAKIEDETGRKPGAKTRKSLKDEALLELLPQAFTKESTVPVWLDFAAGRLCVGTTSTGRLDAALSLLAKALPGLTLAPLTTAESPAVCMRAWLLDGVAPAGFGIGRETELRSPDAQGATVRYSKHGLDGQDVQQHLGEGKQVRKLALNWQDRAEFVLTDALQLTGIKFDVEPAAGEGDDPFDADVVLETAALGGMLAALVVGLGGLA